MHNANDVCDLAGNVTNSKISVGKWEVPKKVTDKIPLDWDSKPNKKALV